MRVQRQGIPRIGVNYRREIFMFFKNKGIFPDQNACVKVYFTLKNADMPFLIPLSEGAML